MENNSLLHRIFTVRTFTIIFYIIFFMIYLFKFIFTYYQPKEEFNNIRYKSPTEYGNDDVNKSLIDFCNKRGYVNNIQPVENKKDIDIKVERLSIDNNKKNLLNDLKSEKVIKEKISSIALPKEDQIEISKSKEFLGYIENSKKETTNYDFKDYYSWW